MTDDQLKALASQVLQMSSSDRRENQLLYYKPAQPRSMDIHRSGATIVGVGGGNGSSKTETCLVELVIAATGIIPLALQSEPIDWSRKVRGAINTRVVCNSLTNTLHQIILPKLRWDHWTGLPEGEKTGDFGHYGWIPRACLIDGDWEKSWSEKKRILRVLHRDHDNPDRILGESTIQFMSHDQDTKDFESGDLGFVLLDEPPRLSVYQANEARIMRNKGRMLLAMTWPDDPTIPVDWIYDRIYDPGRPGPKKDPKIDWIELHTTENKHIDQESIAEQSKRWDANTRKRRLYGQQIRFSNRIHPLFTEQEEWFCFVCGDQRSLSADGSCFECDSNPLAALAGALASGPAPAQAAHEHVGGGDAGG
jgi:hypothetical protein